MMECTNYYVVVARFKNRGASGDFYPSYLKEDGTWTAYLGHAKFYVCIKDAKNAVDNKAVFDVGKYSYEMNGVYISRVGLDCIVIYNIPDSAWKWKSTENGYECPYCKEHVDTKYNYCPHCGMKVGKV